MPEGADSDDERQSQVDLQPGENAESEVRLAPHKLRLLALLIDVLFFAGVVGLGFLAGKFYGWLGLLLWVVAAVTFVYYVAATVWLMDQTFGKAMAGLRVRRIDGSAPSHSLGGLVWSVGRHTIGYLIADVIFLGSAAALFTPRRRALHDYAFGSEVVLVPSAERAKPHGTRYREFWEVFSMRYEATQAEYRWLLWPWKWLIRIMSAVGALFTPFLVREASAAVHSPAATTAASAKPLSVTGQAVLWTTTTLATSAAVAGILTALARSDQVENVNVVMSISNPVDQVATAEIFIMKANGGQLRPLTQNEWPDLEPDLLADRTIVFASEQDGNSDIYKIDIESKRQTRLTQDPARDWSSDWSADGERIVFTSDRSGSSEIHIMNADGSRQARVMESDSYSAYPDWSPDGKQIAFTSDYEGAENIFLVNADGTNVRQVTMSGGTAPVWSPDGGLIAFVSSRDGDDDIYVIKPDGSGERRLTEDPSEDPAKDFTPFWAPDGSKILFFSERGLRTGNELYAMNPNGSDEIKLTNLKKTLPAQGR